MSEEEKIPGGAKRRAKVVGLFSGGLDSLLSAHLMVVQGAEILLLHFLMPWQTLEEDGRDVTKRAEELGLPLEFIHLDRDYIAMLKDPPHGYGKNMNPCIDCHIFMFRRAGERMEEMGWDLVFTGEVVGERPMSQRKPILNLIEREAGLVGRLLRPLSAKLLTETIPEKEGLIERDKLLVIEGRSRKPQMELAEEYGISEYSSPAGGCLLTDPAFSKRVRESFEWGEDTPRHFKLLRLGRHFRLPGGAKVVVGRNQGENERISELAQVGDMLLDPVGVMGPTVLLGKEGGISENVETAASLCARYSDGSVDIDVQVRRKGEEGVEVVVGRQLESDVIENLRI